MFLDPLNALLSSSTVYHLLLEATANDQHRRSFLHSFALKLGIKILIDDYRSLTLKKPSTSVLVTEPVIPVSKPVNPESDKVCFIMCHIMCVYIVGGTLAFRY